MLSIICIVVYFPNASETDSHQRFILRFRSFPRPFGAGRSADIQLPSKSVSRDKMAATKRQNGHVSAGTTAAMDPPEKEKKDR